MSDSDSDSSIERSLEAFLNREGILNPDTAKYVPTSKFDQQSAASKSLHVNKAEESFTSSIYDEDGYGSNSIQEESKSMMSDASPSQSMSGNPLYSTDLTEMLLPSAMKINKILDRQGYTTKSFTKYDIDSKKLVSVHVVERWSESVLNTLMELLERSNDQEKSMIDASISQKRNDITFEALESNLKDLQKKLLVSERKNKDIEAQLTKHRADAADRVASAKTGVNDSKRTVKILEDKNKELGRRVRQRDHELERLKAKLNHVAEKERETASRHRAALNMVRQGDSSVLSGTSIAPSSRTLNDSRMSTSSSRSKKELNMQDVVEALENQRDELERRNEELEDQVKDLTIALKDAGNGEPLRSAETSMTQDGDADESVTTNKSETAAAMYIKIKEQQRKIEQLQHKCAVFKSNEMDSAQLMEKLKERNEELREELENVRLEMDTRPTIKQWKEKQKEVTDLENKMHDFVMKRGETAELEAWKKHMSVTDKIRVDKKNHELGLWVLDSLPTAVTKEVLQGVCRELDVSDVSDIQPSIGKLKAVVKAVPRMEKFITQICKYLFERDKQIQELNGRGLGGKDRPTMEDVLPVLQSWWLQMQKVDNLAAFQDRVLAELHRREQLLTQQSVDVSEDVFGPGLRFRWSEKEIGKAYDIIRDCVNFEVEVMRHKKR